MDVHNVTEDWDSHVSTFLPDMNNCDEGFFSPHELLAGTNQTTAVTSTTTAASTQSPVSGANAPSLSPSAGSGTGAPSGALSPGALSQASNAAAPPGSCCENGRPIMTDPVSGQTVCSCQYDSARLALSSYARIPPTGVGVYGTPYPSTDQNPYQSIGVDSSAFYSPLSNPYALKESGPASDMSAWTSAGLQPTTGYYPYDPTLAAYGYGAGYDLAARRKNATRESTATLKAWLNEHKKNPYPTKGEKIMLAIITKMTLTQVSTWFANARRRLKKENKMTWEPKNKTDDDDDAMVSDDEKDKDDLDSDKQGDHKDTLHRVKSEHDKDDDDDDDLTDDDRKLENLGLMSSNMGHMSHMGLHHPSYQHHAIMYPGNVKNEIIGSKNQASSDCGVPIPATKPKIWSLADTAACKTPPPSEALQLHHHRIRQQQQQHQHQHRQQISLHHPHQQQQQLTWMGNYPHHHQLQQQQLQPQQPHHPQQDITTHPSGGNGTNIMSMAGHTSLSCMNQQQQVPRQQLSSQGQQMRQQGQQHTTTTPQPQEQQMNMMSTFGNSTYSRYGGFQETSSGIASQTYHNSSTTSMHHLNSPTTPISNMLPMNTNVSITQHSQLRLSHQHQQSQSATMGFPEVQTDTPPQTPPNMRLPSVAANLITGTASPTTSLCYNAASNSSSINGIHTNNLGIAINNPIGEYSGDSSPSSSISSYVGNYSRMQESSPTTDFPQNVMNNQHHDMAAAAFKPFYKSQQITSGFVSPV